MKDILVLLFGLLFWGGIIWGIMRLLNKSRTPLESGHTPLKPIGGWLAFFILGNFLGGIFNFNNFPAFQTFSAMQPQPIFTVYFAADALIASMFGLMQCIIGYRLCKRAVRSGVQAKGLMGIGAIYFTLSSVIGICLFSISPYLRKANPLFLTNHIMIVPTALIWFFYFKHSQRVKDTLPV